MKKCTRNLTLLGAGAVAGVAFGATPAMAAPPPTGQCTQYAGLPASIPLDCSVARPLGPLGPVGPAGAVGTPHPSHVLIIAVGDDPWLSSLLDQMSHTGQAGPGGSIATTTGKTSTGAAAQAGSGMSAQAGSGATAQAGSGMSAQAGSGATAQAGSGTSAQTGSGTSAQTGSGTSAQTGSLGDIGATVGGERTPGA